MELAAYSAGVVAVASYSVAASGLYSVVVVRWRAELEGPNFAVAFAVATAAAFVAEDRAAMWEAGKSVRADSILDWD